MRRDVELVACSDYFEAAKMDGGLAGLKEWLQVASLVLILVITMAEL